MDKDYSKENSVSNLVAALAQRLITKQWMAATAESCTGGGIAAALTDLAGSSAWFDAGFITYSNAAKQRMLGVSPEHFREEWDWCGERGSGARDEFGRCCTQWCRRVYGRERGCGPRRW